MEGPPQRPASRPGRDAGGLASVVRPLSRRMLGGRRHARTSPPLETHDRRSFRPPHAIQSLAILLHQRPGISRVSADVRGPRRGAAVRDQLRHVAQGERADGSDAASGCRTRWTPSNTPTARPTASGARCGAKRPSAPFNLKYMEIGNENGGPAYQRALRPVLRRDQGQVSRDALDRQRMARHARNGPIEIVDEHYYASPEFFIANADKIRHLRPHRPQGLCRRIRGHAENAAKATCAPPWAKRPS